MFGQFAARPDAGASRTAKVGRAENPSNREHGRFLEVLQYRALNRQAGLVESLVAGL
jgi:hypothetical protein